jgi:hypothetical protein
MDGFLGRMGRRRRYYSASHRLRIKPEHALEFGDAGEYRQQQNRPRSTCVFR